MRNITHPNFILGVISLILLFIGVGMWANSYTGGFYVWIAAFVLGGIHWVWSIVDVFRHFNARTPNENLSIIWVILVIIVPPVGGLLYYAFNRRVAM